MTFYTFKNSELADADQVNANFNETIYAILYNRMDQDELATAYTSRNCCTGCWQGLIMKQPQVNLNIQSDTFQDLRYVLCTACGFATCGYEIEPLGKYSTIKNASNLYNCGTSKSDYLKYDLYATCVTTNTYGYGFCDPHDINGSTSPSCSTNFACFILNPTTQYNEICLCGMLRLQTNNNACCTNSYSRTFAMNVGDCCNTYTLCAPCCSMTCQIPINYRLVKNIDANYDLYCDNVCISEVCGASIPINYKIESGCVSASVSDAATTCLCAYGLVALDKPSVLLNPTISYTGNSNPYCNLYIYGDRCITPEKIYFRYCPGTCRTRCDAAVICETSGDTGFLFANYPSQVCLNVTNLSCKTHACCSYAGSGIKLRLGACTYSSNTGLSWTDCGLCCISNCFEFNKINNYCYCVCKNGTPEFTFDARCVHCFCANVGIVGCVSGAGVIYSSLETCLIKSDTQPTLMTCLKTYATPKNKVFYVFSEGTEYPLHTVVADIYDCNDTLLLCDAAPNQVHSLSCSTTTAYAKLKFCNGDGVPLDIKRYAIHYM